MLGLRRLWRASLRVQLALAFALAAAGPALLAVGLGSMALAHAYERQDAIRLRRVTTTVQRRTERLVEDLDRVALQVLQPAVLDAMLQGDGGLTILDAIREAADVDAIVLRPRRDAPRIHAGSSQAALIPPTTGVVTLAHQDAMIPWLVRTRRGLWQGQTVVVQVSYRLDRRLETMELGEAGVRLRVLSPGQELPTTGDGWSDLVSVDLPGEDARVVVWLTGPAPAAFYQRVSRTLVGGALLMVLLAAGLGNLLASRAYRPLVQLQRAARRFGRGERAHAPEDGPEEIHGLVSAFNEMVRNVDDARQRALQAERVAAWQQIARRMAHEIKNPLFPIQTGVETLIKARARQVPDEPEIFEETTRTILEEVDRLSRIVDEFSNLARMPEAAPRAVDAMEVARNVVALLSHLPGANITLEGPPHASVWADRDQLHRLLLNLVKNANEAVAGHPGGRVLVGVNSAPDGATRITVSDTGPGLSDEVRDRLFEPYVTTKPDGTGLGLSLVHRIAMHHGAVLDVDSGPEGTTFTIDWPAAPPADPRRSP